MKSILSIFIIIALKLQILVQLWVIADFVIHQEQIAEDCENKTLVEMQCNGKCQMTKMLKEAESDAQGKQSLPDLTRFMNELQPATVETLQFLGYGFVAQVFELFNSYEQHLQAGFLKDILRPPCA